VTISHAGFTEMRPGGMVIVRPWCAVRNSRAGQAVYRLGLMELQRYSGVLFTTWVLAVCVIGLVVGVTSTLALVTLAAVALMPPLLMRRLLKAPDQSMSESIRAARR
jgi:hypothetical protein